MLRTVFYYRTEAEKQDAMPFEKAKIKNIPIGEGHIFILKIDGNISDYSMCGLAVSDIGEHTTKRQGRIDYLPLCDACGKAWKNHPQSEFAHWVGGK